VSVGVPAWSSGNRFRGGPVWLPSRTSFIELLIALFEDHRPDSIQLVSRGEVVDRRVQTFMVVVTHVALDLLASRRE
jgi:hypothetical protein